MNRSLIGTYHVRNNREDKLTVYEQNGTLYLDRPNAFGLGSGWRAEVSKNDIKNLSNPSLWVKEITLPKTADIEE